MKKFSHAGIIEISIKDSTDRKIESWKFNLEDKKVVAKTFSYIKYKYGLYNPDKNSWVEE